MNFFSAKKIIRGIAFVVIGLSFTFGVNAMRGGGMSNKCSAYTRSNEYKCLGSNLQREVDHFHDNVLSIFNDHRKITLKNKFSDFLKVVNIFLSKFDDNPIDKSRVVRAIGISNLDEGYIVNVCLLRDFIQLSKSSISGRFSDLKYVVANRCDYSASMDEILGATGNQWQWSVRMPNRRKFSVAPIPDDKPVVPNMQNTETDLWCQTNSGRVPSTIATSVKPVPLPLSSVQPMPLPALGMVSLVPMTDNIFVVPNMQNINF